MRKDIDGDFIETKEQRSTRARSLAPATLDCACFLVNVRVYVHNQSLFAKVRIRRCTRNRSTFEGLVVKVIVFVTQLLQLQLGFLTSTQFRPENEQLSRFLHFHELIRNGCCRSNTVAQEDPPTSEGCKMDSMVSSKMSSNIRRQGEKVL